MSGATEQFGHNPRFVVVLLFEGAIYLEDGSPGRGRTPIWKAKKHIGAQVTTDRGIYPILRNC
jgi:hypothetical protein